LFQVNASAVSPFVNYALPHLPEGTTAMADRPQLTTGVTTGAPGTLFIVAGETGAADADCELHGFAPKLETR
jgi:hypothetical protein